MAESDKKNSLVALTKGFISLLVCSGGGEVELAAAEKKLNTTKRRLYDVVNVLAGVGLLEKCGKAKVRWVGSGAATEPVPGIPDETIHIHTIPTEIRNEREALIDELTKSVDEDLEELYQSEFFENYSWISPQEILDLYDTEGITIYALSGSPQMKFALNTNEPKFELDCWDPEEQLSLVELGVTGKK